MTTTPALRRRLLLAGTAAWAALLVILAFWAARHGAPTVRAETTIAQALPTVDRAAVTLIRAAPPGTVSAVSGYRRLGSSCRISAARSGADYERTVDAYVPAGQETALVDGLAARLPASWGVQLDRTGGYPFTADAGDYVAVRGRITGPGHVAVTIGTGCRPSTGPVAEPSGPPPSAALAVLTTLGASPGPVHRVACPGGGYLVTVAATGTVPARTGAVVVDRPGLYVTRIGAVGVVAAGGAIQATTAC